MTPALRNAYEQEMRLARLRRTEARLDEAFRHLERAHILSQRHTVAHVRAHAAMLRIGWLRRDAREVLGQLLRIAAAALFSRIWVPEGNTGGAGVSATKPMPVPDDLRALLKPDARRPSN